MSISVNVLGTPAPKGSARAFINKKTGRAFVAPGGAKTTEKKLKSWDASVRAELLEKLGPLLSGPVYVQRPLHVELHFRMLRPGSHWSKKGGLLPSAPIAPATKPDIDKITRATLDSMTGLAFDDDSRIVSLLVTKLYAAPGQEGALLVVREYDPAIIVTYTNEAELAEDEAA